MRQLQGPPHPDSVIGSRVSHLSILNSREDLAYSCRDVPDVMHARATLLLHVGKPSLLQFLRIVLKTQLAAGKNQTLNLLVGRPEVHRYGGVHSRS
uniref:Uncharacterized protein n=1 Tax=uncultured delta proteobacterium HF0770_45N15 TaxID=710835 RepID=E0XYY3_9DELT|nr:hypothetical protein [uncultured delta proteobacterium HF0770_45N15]